MGAGSYRAGCIGHRAESSSIRARKSARSGGGKAAAAIGGPGDIPAGGKGAGTFYNGGDTGDACTIVHHRRARAAVDAGGRADHADRVSDRDLHVIDIGNSVAGADGGKRYSEVAVIDIRRCPGGAPKIIISAV